VPLELNVRVVSPDTHDPTILPPGDNKLGSEIQPITLAKTKMEQIMIKASRKELSLLWACDF
jgi:hypothetical protein